MKTGSVVHGAVEPYNLRNARGELRVPGIKYSADLEYGQILALFDKDRKLCTIELSEKAPTANEMFLNLKILQTDPSLKIEIQTVSGKKILKDSEGLDFQVSLTDDFLTIDLTDGKKVTAAYAGRRFNGTGSLSSKLDKASFLIGGDAAAPFVKLK